MASGFSTGAQTFTEPTSADLVQLEKQRAVVTRLLDDKSLEKYAKPVGKLGALRAVLSAGLFKPSQTYELQSLGIVLGDVFVQDMGFRWVFVEDEFGRDLALRYQNTSIVLFPLTMISKRIERGEPIDVFELYNGVAAEAQKLIDREPER
jgi:hypothetical protein